MPRAAFTNSGSPKLSRSRLSAWEIAGWLSSSSFDAWPRCPCRHTASKTRSKFRSKSFTALMRVIHAIDLRNEVVMTRSPRESEVGAPTSNMQEQKDDPGVSSHQYCCHY